MSKPVHRFDVFDIDDDVEIAHAVTAKTAAELTSVPVALIEDRVVRFGRLGVTIYGQELSIRRTHDE
jgi:hypothetical protein